MKAIMINEHGGSEKLNFVEVEAPKIDATTARVIHEAIAVNHTDIHHREGILPTPALPLILGHEAIGYVEEAGVEIEHLNYNDRVIYATGGLGAYAEQRVIDPRFLVNVPDDLKSDEVIAVYSKGLAAHYLLYRCYNVLPKHIVLIHGVTGALGQILCQWAKYKGATVIGTVSTDEKAKLAKQIGCDHAIVYSRNNYLHEIMAISPRGVDVAYDLVGKATYKGSLYCLAAFGVLVIVGSASGEVPEIQSRWLYEKCLYITRPRLEVYKMKREELILSANEVFNMLRNRTIAPRIYEYKFDQIGNAHQDISDRVVAGSCIVKL